MLILMLQIFSQQVDTILVPKNWIKKRLRPFPKWKIQKIDTRTPLVFPKLETRTTLIVTMVWVWVLMHTRPLWSKVGSLAGFRVFQPLGLYNTNEFRTETMYDCYIAMKSMFLVVKLSSHSSIGYASLTILLPWITHKQHQNYYSPKLCIHS
jgi:hypothetical protein